MVGAIPRGTYYLVDRQSGGRLGWLRDLNNEHFGSTDRRNGSCSGMLKAATAP
ncbi:hypothetical protein [Paraburkholderia youngii]|uniref:hypothetical protein n=1 Tax=Paraburkholderia youngii TaxID=2782701 RepID=UPI00281556FC|nr:hypothetical protein [Paraburkholderia youngii]